MISNFRRGHFLFCLLCIPVVFAAYASAQPAEPSSQTPSPQTPASTPPVPEPATTAPPTPHTTQTEVEDQKQKQDKDGLTIELAPHGQYVFESNVKESLASVSRGSAGLGVNFSAPLGDRARWTLGVSADAYWYSFKDAGGLLPSGKDPITDAYSLAFTPGISYQIDRQWAVLGGAIIDFSGASGADIGDSATYGGYAGAQYKFSNELALTLGGIVRSRLENGTSIFPLVGIEWKINDRVSLSTTPREGLPGASVDVKLDHDLDVAIFGTYDRREFRLDSGDAIDQGVVRDTRVQIGVSLGWKPTPNISLRVTGGVQVYQDLIFDDQHGQRVNEKEVDPAPFVGLSGRFVF